MFCLFFIISIVSFAQADLNSLWLDAGCTSDGVLSPATVPHFWDTVVDQEEYINEIKKGIQAGDRMYIRSCMGTSELTVGKTLSASEPSETFHLLWECSDKQNCILPAIHTLCLRTLRVVHPQATINLWSMTLNPTLMGPVLEDLNVQLKFYDLSFFEGLPPAAIEASSDIQSFFSQEKDAYSHWSDLFRAAVLYKLGGVYTDLDSIWLRPIDEVSQATSWIPSTPTAQEKLEEADVITIGNQRLFLEGGIMRFEEPRSPFLWRVLSEFPKYNKDVAECWACVGPRHLTVVFNQFLKENSQTPDLVDSQKVFGLKSYRNYFHNVHQEFDPTIWNQTLTKHVVAAHMFSGTPQGGIQKDSTISTFFQVGGVDNVVTKISASWREVKERRRGLLSSLYYLSNTISEADMQQFYGSAFLIGNEQVQLSPNAYVSEQAVQGGGSAVFYAGEQESVNSVVTMACQPTTSHVEEIRNIYYSGFGVPLSAVVATISGQNTVQVLVKNVDPHTVNSDAATVSLNVGVSSNLCSGTTVTSMDLPAYGYTDATLTVETEVFTTSEHLAAQFEIVDILVSAFDIPASDLDTVSTYKTHGRVSCAVSSTDGLSELYETELERKFGRNVEYTDTGDFWVLSPTFNSALDAKYYIANNAVSFTFSQFCFWAEDEIALVSKNTIRKTGVTYTDMETDLDEAKANFVQQEYVISHSLIETVGTQAYGACDMYQECQSDYEQLYLESVGDLNIVEKSATEEISWWWRFQLSTFLSSEIDQLRQHNGFFVYEYEGRYVNTCVQHEETWINSCDDTIGVCAGNQNYGYSGQQADALQRALQTTGKRHPNCPYGCESLLKSGNENLKNSLVTASLRLPDTIPTTAFNDVCVMNGKYYVWGTPVSLLDTCVGHSDNNAQPCELSHYTFCSDVDYTSGLVTYGNSTMQGYGLTQALKSTNSRHPHCT